MFPTLVLTNRDLRTPFLSLDKVKGIKAFTAKLACQPLPLAVHSLLPFGAAGTTSAKGNLTSLPLLKSLLLKYTRIIVALWPAVFAEDSHYEPANYQGSSLLCSITISREGGTSLLWFPNFVLRLWLLRLATSEGLLLHQCT